jgi:hypothetical protein
MFADTISSIIKGTPAKDAVAAFHTRVVALFKQFGLPGTK